MRRIGPTRLIGLGGMLVGNRGGGGSIPAADLVWDFRGDSLDPVRGSEETPTVLRTGTKLIQTTQHAGIELAQNVGAVSDYFNGSAIAGVVREGAHSTLIADHDISGANWLRWQTAAVKDQTDPFGVANNAWRITQSNNDGSAIYTIAQDPSNKNAIGGCWTKPLSTEGQTCVVAISDNNYDDIGYCTPNGQLDVWSYCPVEHEFGAGAVDLRVLLLADYLGEDVASAAFYIPTVNLDTKLIVSPSAAGFNAEIMYIDVPAGFLMDEGTIYLETQPNHAPDDGVNHLHLCIKPLEDATTKVIWISKRNTNALSFAYDDGLAEVAVTDDNFARSSVHKIAISWNASSLKLFLNGVEVAEDTTFTHHTGAFPDGARIYLGSYFGSPWYVADAVVVKMNWWKKRLADAQALRLTS